jgi:hypothetical protein
MNLPAPGPAYSRENEAQTREALVRADQQNRKRSEDLEVGAARLILRAPDGGRWSVTVSNAGVLAAVAL